MKRRDQEIFARRSKMIAPFRSVTLLAQLVLGLLLPPTAADSAAQGNHPSVDAGLHSEASPEPAVCDRRCAEQRNDFLLRTWTYARKSGQTYDYRMCDPRARTPEGEACRAVGLVICDGASVGAATIVRQPSAPPGSGPDVIIGAGHSFVNDTTGGRRRDCYFEPNGAGRRAYPISYVKIGPLTKDAKGQVIAGDYAVGLVDGGVGTRHGAMGYVTLSPMDLSQLIARGTRFRQLGYLPRLGKFVISDNGLPLSHRVPQLGAAQRDQYRHSFNTVVGFSGGPQTISTRGGYSVYCVQVNMLTANGINQDNEPFDALTNPSACTRIDGALRMDIERAFDFARTGRTRAGAFDRMVFSVAR